MDQDQRLPDPDVIEDYAKIPINFVINPLAMGWNTPRKLSSCNIPMIKINIPPITIPYLRPWVKLADAGARV